MRPFPSVRPKNSLLMSIRQCLSLSASTSTGATTDRLELYSNPLAKSRHGPLGWHMELFSTLMGVTDRFL